MLCTKYLVSDGCGEWINLDAIRKIDIIRMDGSFGKQGYVLAKMPASRFGDSVRRAKRSLFVMVGRGSRT